MKSLHLSIDYKGKHIEGKATPIELSHTQGVPLVHQLIIGRKDYGLIRCTKENWSADKIKYPELVKIMGN